MREAEIAIIPAIRKYHLYVPYSVVARDDANPTVPKPNTTTIIGDKQHRDAIATGRAEILKISLNFSIYFF